MTSFFIIELRISYLLTQSFYAFLTIADIFINKDLSGKKSLYKSKICAINVLKNCLKSSYAYIEKVKTYFSGNNIYTFFSAWAKNIFQSVIITPKALCKIMFFQRWKKATLIATITNTTWSKIYSIYPVHIVGKLLFIEGFNHAGTVTKPDYELFLGKKERVL